MMNKGLLNEIWDFLKVRKVWWMVPILIMLLLVGLVIYAGSNTAVSVFVYTLF